MSFGDRLLEGILSGYWCVNFVAQAYFAASVIFIASCVLVHRIECAFFKALHDLVVRQSSRWLCVHRLA